MKVIIGIIIPFIGTVLGSSLVFFSLNKISKKIENIILGISAGVMLAASIWSLIIPSMNYGGGILFTVLGLISSFLFFFLIDLFQKKKKGNSSKMMFAITLHNIPEGMAVGVAFASFLTGNISLMSCYALSIGIAIQNFPEGFIVSVPLKQKGYSKCKSFVYGIISALFELGGAILTLIFTNVVSILLPFLLSFAAGAMIYVVIVELIPESSSDSNINTIGFLIGFLVMMCLDTFF